MNVCRRRRKEIALLVLNAIGGESARQLRSHLENCPGCREHLAEISKVSDRIRGAKIENGIEASPVFHQKLIAALHRQESRPERFATAFKVLVSHRLARAAAGLVLLATAAAVMSWLGQQRKSLSIPDDRTIVAGLNSSTPKDVEPTISNYSAVANRSFEQFDELLTQQANKHFPRFPIYTAGGVSASSLADYRDDL